MRKVIALLLVIMLFSACDFSSTTEVNESELKDIFVDIEIAFSMLDINAIMNHYTYQYLHNGNDYDEEYQIWDSRLNSYNVIDFDDIEISYVGDNYAEITFILKLSNNSYTNSWEEPSIENGDVSYFKKIDGEWKINGNQLD